MGPLSSLPNRSRFSERLSQNETKTKVEKMEEDADIFVSTMWVRFWSLTRHRSGGRKTIFLVFGVTLKDP